MILPRKDKNIRNIVGYRAPVICTGFPSLLSALLTSGRKFLNKKFKEV